MKPSDYIRKGWCQRALAKDNQGQFVDPPSSPSATSWCIVGAIQAAYSNNYITKERVIDKLYANIPANGSAVKWNDTPGRTQAEVIALLESIGE